MNKYLEKIRQELIEKSEKEAVRLWRLARRAIRHGCSLEMIAKIREEASWCNTTGTAYPDRLISADVMDNFQYAFKI